MARKRVPRRFDFPSDIVCKFCTAKLLRHCKRCAWYPCNACKTITKIIGLSRKDDGSLVWQLIHRKTDKRFFYFLK